LAEIRRTTGEVNVTALQAWVVFGTRPEAIKLAPLITALKQDPRFELSVISTGQHEAILDWVLETFEIVPDHNLAIHSPGNTINELCVRTIEGIAGLLRAGRPDVLIVQGDTTAAMASGLAAFNDEIPVVHLEAGLRTHQLLSPFPEEMNRRVLAQLASRHLAPTPLAVQNLRGEGVPPERICCTGNTVVDALHFITVTHPLPAADSTELVLVTTHRRESWGRPLHNVAAALVHVARDRPATSFVVAMHPNPMVRDIWAKAASGTPNVLLSDSVPYPQMVNLLQRASVVVTDSGGLQEEAPTFGKPVLVLREHTERLEGVQAGSARLVGTDGDVVYQELTAVLTDPIRHSAMAGSGNPYGDGRAAERCVAALAHWFLGGEPAQEFAFVPVRST
jgi:UDP-N-acetylglucosamine 2-epimerase (non-hydrolysing)